ncbi:hypothetical protein CBR_g21973 [Chara braunii]|uniref:Protein kinase domain-containing protein n=1 Tax=Chara braunii TaxID=69332 RepID=A0A388L1P2_CHABU|nr:hypothetical protein CBR_g21973 [Chara braunii]|eukprot:GBG76225.1 hypothetical protein CBR_g21973 [Chara braunii]
MNVRGTRGYLDPEYNALHRLTEKSDTFSVGVVFLELISGKPPLFPTKTNAEMALPEWARAHLQKNQVNAIIDSNLPAGSYSMDSLCPFAHIAMRCCEPYGAHRPELSELLATLTKANKCQAEWAKSHRGQGPSRRVPRR